MLAWAINVWSGLAEARNLLSRFSAELPMALRIEEERMLNSTCLPLTAITRQS